MGISVGMAVSVISDNKISAEKLNEMIENHKLWLEDHSKGVRADFSGFSLSELDLSGANLSEAIFDNTSMHNSKMVGTNLKGAKVSSSNWHSVNLTDAVMVGICMIDSQLCHSNLTRVQAPNAKFITCTMWDDNFFEAEMSCSRFINTELCDGNFESAKLCYCDFFEGNLDYAYFKNANLGGSSFSYIDNLYYACFEGANMEDIFVSSGSEFGDDAIKGAKGFHLPIACPEEGSFYAWRKSRDNRLVKLLIPENALRTGAGKYTIRASEAEIAEIYEGDTACEDTVGLLGDKKTYHKGERVNVKDYDGSLYHDGAGIHFCFSRAEAELIEYKEKEEDEDE